MRPRLFLLLLFLPMFAPAQSGADLLFAQKRYAEARKAYLDMHRSHPSDATVLERLGDSCAHLESWQEAAAYYSRLIALEPKNPRAHYKYGGALAMQAASGSKWKAVGLADDIREAFETAILLDAKHIEARWALVEYYLRLPGILGGSEHKAKRYATELEALSPVDGWLAKGRIAEYFGRYDIAERHYVKAHKIGNSQTTYAKLLQLYTKTDKAKAKALTDAYRKSSTNPKTTT